MKMIPMRPVIYLENVHNSSASIESEDGSASMRVSVERGEVRVRCSGRGIPELSVLPDGGVNSLRIRVVERRKDA